MSPADKVRDEGARPAGPVPGVGSSSSQAAGEDPTPAPPAGDADESEAREVEEDFVALLADAHRERDEYLGLARRTKADFENYRKRVAADVQAAAARGRAEVAREVIDAVDNLERALEAADGSGDGLASGVEMVLGSLRETLQRHGIEVVDPAGEKF